MAVGDNPQLAFMAAQSQAAAAGGVSVPPFGLGGFIDSLSLESLTMEQQAELLASVQQHQGNPVGMQQVVMAHLQKI